MKRYLLIALGLLLSTCLLSSCVVMLLGAGVAGGLVATHDAVHLQFNTDFEEAWRTTRTALDRMGVINAEDHKAGTIEATVQESHVVATITSLTASSMKIEIKARKNLLPNMDLANKILNDINNRLHASL